MSFYSSLLLVANDGGRQPTATEVYSLLGELGLFAPGSSDAEFCNLADHASGLFRDPIALAENPRFFAPDSIGFNEGVMVLAPDGDYSGPGWGIKIHGNGYFFPWTLSDLRDRATRSPVLSRLRTSAEERFGGRFVFPPADESLLRERLIEDAGGWVWFASESM